MRVIVCGGRHYHEKDIVEEVLNRLILEGMTTLVHGGCPTGADALADSWADELGEQLTVEVYRAAWDRDGLSAGPLRNQRMVDLGADMVIAFPGGRGTNDLVRRARKAGIHVLTVGP